MMACQKKKAILIYESWAIRQIDVAWFAIQRCRFARRSGVQSAFFQPAAG
jgi:hypothetical protein